MWAAISCLLSTLTQGLCILGIGGKSLNECRYIATFPFCCSGDIVEVFLMLILSFEYPSLDDSSCVGQLWSLLIRSSLRIAKMGAYSLAHKVHTPLANHVAITCVCASCACAHATESNAAIWWLVSSFLDPYQSILIVIKHRSLLSPYLNIQVMTPKSLNSILCSSPYIFLKPTVSTPILILSCVVDGVECSDTIL